MLEYEITTIKDFSVQGKIPIKLYNNFIQNEVAEGEKNHFLAFKTSLIENIRNYLHEKANLSPELTGIVDI